MFGKKVNVKKINEVADLSAKVLKVLYLLLIALAFYVLIRLFKETKILRFFITLLKVVFPLFIGLLVAWLFDPFVSYLESKKIGRLWGAIITYVILFFVIFLILSSLIPLLIDQVKEFINMVPGVFLTVKGWGSDFLNHFQSNELVDVSNIKSHFFASAETFMADVTTTMPQNFIGFVSKMFSLFGTFILGLIIGFFLIVNFDSSSKLFNFIPKKYREITVELLDNVNVSLRSYVRGAIIDCGIIFILSSLGLWMVGLKVPALFGLFCGLTNIIPYAGPYIGGAPAVIVGFTQNPMIGVLSLIVIAVIQFLEGNFLQPLIMSKTTKLHPVTIMLGLLIFGYFFGIIGMLISTPLISTVKTTFKFYDERYGIIKKEDMESHETL